MKDVKGTAALGWAVAATLGTGVPAFAWGMYAFAQGGERALPGAIAIAMGGMVAAAGVAVAIEALSRLPNGRGR